MPGPRQRRECSCPGWEQRGGCARREWARHAGSAWEGAWRPEREVSLLPPRAGPAQRPVVLRSGRAAGATSAPIGPGPAALGVPGGSAAAVTCPPAALGALHRLAEPFGAEGTCRPIPFPPGPEQGHLPRDRAARIPVQPGLQHSQGWGSVSGSFPAHAPPPRLLTTTTSGPVGARP